MAPEKIEVVFMRSKYVAQAFVEGDSLQVGSGTSWVMNKCLLAFVKFCVNVFLFELILYISVNNFSVMLRHFLG